MTPATDRRHTGTRTLSTPAFFSGLTANARKLIVQSAEVRKFRPNSVIVNAGDQAVRLFLLKKGKVKYYRVTRTGDEVLLWWVSAGEIFGIAALAASPLRYIGTAQAVDDCELLVWSRKKIRQLAAAHDQLSQNALAILFHYLSEYADRLVGLVSETAGERLAHTLLRLGHRTGRVRSEGVEVAITNQHLSSLADVSAFTASRQLQQWEREGILRKGRGKIVIVSPESLVNE
jgi:CRP/FNR family transcriptional regulator, nitrogen oxide reductase regulator